MMCAVKLCNNVSLEYNRRKGRTVALSEGGEMEALDVTARQNGVRRRLAPCMTVMQVILAALVAKGALAQALEQPSWATPPQVEIKGVLTEVSLVEWVQEPGAARQAFFTLHTKSGDLRGMRPASDIMGQGCVPGDRATLLGIYAPGRPRDLNHFLVLQVLSCRQPWRLWVKP